MNTEELKRLATITRYAHAIHTQLLDQDLVKQGRVHFRPTTSGITLVSLAPDTPQLGKSGFQVDHLKSNLDHLFQRYCLGGSLGRATPEKMVQSYLLSDAYSHRLELHVLKAGARDLEGTTLHFITDELALRDESGKVLCDIIGLLERGNAQIPLLIELKSERRMTELIRQLDEYSHLFGTYRAQLEALFAATLGQIVKFTAPPQKWIVWPNAGQARDPREDELAAKGIRVIEYSSSSNGYVFRVGKPPKFLS